MNTLLKVGFFLILVTARLPCLFNIHIDRTGPLVINKISALTICRKINIIIMAESGSISLDVTGHRSL